MKPISIRKHLGGMRYDTVGDWYDRDNQLHVLVAPLGDPRYEFLVALHELVEAKLCQHRGITADMVDKFDFAWGDETEPGDDEAAPYHKEHQFATRIEKLMAEEMGVDWDEYEKALNEAVVKVPHETKVD